VRFYVPEWEDHVDAEYDFLHDEHSALDRSERDLAYIWDLFDRSETPIDGVLISREQVEESPAKFDRLTATGIYDAPELDVPEWLPTISDCGAWGYKQLPFPPYGNEGMLEFYDRMDVTVGVTIDHLVLGSGHAARLYLDERAFSDEFSQSDLPDGLVDAVDDVMIDAWPEQWPPYVDEYESSIRSNGDVEPFDPALFEGSAEAVLDRLDDDPRAVYRDDDMQFRFDLTLDNAAEMRELYDANDYGFRPMVAIQGWDPDSYVEALDAVLEMGYQYVGIGGVAGTTEEVVKEIVSAVGNRITAFEQEHTTRIDSHVFGFAKTGAFETVGRSGVSSFDSASMLRAAWTGGDNYHVDADRRYDALRVRYPGYGDDLETAIETALRGQEVLFALRAYDQGQSIDDALARCHETAERAIDGLAAYLEANRWDDRYDHRLLNVVEGRFREDYEHGRALKARLGEDLRSRIVKLLRADGPDNSVPWGDYLELIAGAKRVLDDRGSSLRSEIDTAESGDDAAPLEQLWPLIESYTEYIGDEEHLDAYRELLEDEPWRECDCPMCRELGIEVAVFRGNNRNRRRGFHNTRRFYDLFAETLPKVLVLTQPGTGLLGADSVEAYLRRERPAFWEATHELPVAEVGVATASGVHEWWDVPPDSVSLDPSGVADALGRHATDYQVMLVDSRHRSVGDGVRSAVEASDCRIETFDDPSHLRRVVYDELGFPMQSLLSGF
jgi:hypothetical protein